MSRRELIRFAAIVASTPLVPVLDPEAAYADAAKSDVAAIPMNAELVTLTETSAVVTWYSGVPGFTGDKLKPAPMDSEVLLGTSPASLSTVHHTRTKTPFHYVEILGLEPGQTYYWQARSDGKVATPADNFPGNPVGTVALSQTDRSNPVTAFRFTTPQPPPGKFLFSFALANDMHMGETVAGLAATEPLVGGVPPGITQVHGEPPYPVVMGKAMVTDAKARGADKLFVAGDVSAEAVPHDLRHVHHILNMFGKYKQDYFVARGNHDRAHEGPAYTKCTPYRLNHEYRDCFADVFADHTTTWFSAETNGMRVIGLDTYDTVGNGGNNGSMTPEQFNWFRHELKAHKDIPTLVFGHHPITAESDIVNDEPIRFDLNLHQSQQIQQLYAETPGVFFHHSGHTHRNKRTESPSANAVTFLEVGATKEYPGGFTLVRIHEGGYAANFYKTRSPLAREWSERTRAEYFGQAPKYMAGTIGDRNFVVSRDLSGLKARH